MNKILIIDINYVFNKFYYVNKTNPLYKDGGIYGFMYFMSLINRNNIQEFSKIYLIFDTSSEKHKRKELFPDYKGNRSDRSGTVYKNWNDFLLLLTFLSDKFILLKSDYHEADEIIAAVSIKESKRKQVIIHSGDKDLLQLCAVNNIKISEKYSKGEFILLSKKDIYKKFKITKDKDYSFISEDLRTLPVYKVFKGDVSDNIPPAIPKFPYTSIKKVISKYNYKYLDDENLADNIINNLNDMNLKHKIAGAFDSILRNYKIMDLLHCHKDFSVLENTKRLKKSIKDNNKKILGLCNKYSVDSKILGIYA